MILTDREIQLSLENGQITVTPEPADDAFSSTSLDLTLDEPGAIWKARRGRPIRPGAKGYNYHRVAARQKKLSLANYHLAPRSFVLAWTRETISLPSTSRVAARVEGKSSLARLGVGIHVTAPTIHAGFTGQIQLEIFNFGPNDIILDVGMRICQVIFEITLGTPAKGYAGRFVGQAGTA